MENKILQPDQVIVADYEPNDYDLWVYFRIFDKGNLRNIAPPVLVATPLLSDRNFLVNAFPGDKGELEAYFARIDNLGNAFYLLNELIGTDEAVASTLCHMPIEALVLQNDDDLIQLKEMIDTGDLCGMSILDHGYVNEVGSLLKSTVTSLEQSYYQKEIFTLKGLVEKLILERDVPKYMETRYKRGDSKIMPFKMK